jgi:hypothetical protein
VPNVRSARSGDVAAEAREEVALDGGQASRALVGGDGVDDAGDVDAVDEQHVDEESAVSIRAVVTGMRPMPGNSQISPATLCPRRDRDFDGPRLLRPMSR